MSAWGISAAWRPQAVGCVSCPGPRVATAIPLRLSASLHAQKQVADQVAGWDWWLNPQQDLKENGHAPAPEDVTAVEAVMRKIIESTLVSVDGVIGDP